MLGVRAIMHYRLKEGSGGNDASFSTICMMLPHLAIVALSFVLEKVETRGTPKCKNIELRQPQKIKGVFLTTPALSFKHLTL